MPDYPDRVAGFIGDVLLQPAWVQLWFLWMVAVVVLAPLPLLRRGTARLDGPAAAGSALFLAAAMPFWHAEVGYTRILGLPHFLAWGPLLAWLWWRRANLASPRRVRWAALVLAATIAVSLAFDGVDAVRYALGERGSLGAARG